MKNLKITFNMKSPLILDRTTTIDGILLALYYDYLKQNGQVLPFDKEHKRVKFIQKEHGVFSGSIWYIDKDDDVLFDFTTFIKKPEHKKIYDATKKKILYNPNYKAYLKTEESFFVEKIHFYINAEEEIVNALFTNALFDKKTKRKKRFFIGKKQSVGFGEVDSIVVDRINENKGYMLNETTPSKPLPVADFHVKTKKVAQMRRMPPYWLEEDLEPCYMPTTSLYEQKDSSGDNDDFTFGAYDYEHNCNFIYKEAQKHKEIGFKDIPIDKITKVVNSKKIESTLVDNNEKFKCSITGSIEKNGVRNKIKSFIGRLKPNFSDYITMKSDDFISDVALWNIENISELAYSYVDQERFLYLQGKNAADGTRYKDFILNPSMLKPPFSINLKDTQNAQHVSIKGKVSISNAYFTVQYGNSQLQVDNEMLQNAIKDINIITKNKEITKSHLCGIFDNTKSVHPDLKQKVDNVVNRKLIADFQKKYNSHIRVLLASVKLE